MPEVTLPTLSGSTVTLADDVVAAFGASLRGDLLATDSPGYDAARTIWNAMIDARPALIARCRSTADVVRAVRFARRNDLLSAVRGGGHNVAGNSTVDGGFVIDLSSMKGIRLDPARRIAHVEPGITLAELDRDTQEFGLAVPTGINSTTGIAGLTLGGGYGWLTRRFGLTADNLLAADVVTADGDVLTANEAEHSDLFWALRGGGGNFGIVTSFEFKLHRVGPEVTAGLVVYPLDRAATVLAQYRELVANAPEELTVWVVMREAPPLPFLPPAVHGTPVVVLALCYTGDPSRADRALAPLATIDGAHGAHVGPMPFAAWQAAFDPLMLGGVRNYWKTHNFSALGDELVDALLARMRQLPGPMCEIFLGHVAGAPMRVAEDETAFMGRAPFMMNVHARWDSAADDERAVSWARDVYRASAPFAAPGAYVNFMSRDEGARVPAAYGSHYERLAAIKAKFDPTNFFRLNQNIIPQPAAARPEATRPETPTPRRSSEEVRPM
jgi:FAD/FMN-containing dehydrogenase